MYVLGDNGLERTRKIALQNNTLYYMGASTSPKQVLVTRLTTDRIHYRDGRAFENERTIERAIGEDLIARGTRNYLNGINIEGFERFVKAKAPEWMYEERERLTAILAGEPVPAIEDVPAFLDDQKQVRVTVAAAEGADFTDTRAGDPWYAAEAYGSVTGLEIDGVQHYKIRGTKGTLSGLYADVRFNVITVEEVA